MELMFVIVIAAGVGLIPQVAFRKGAASYGALVPLSLSAAVTALVWVALVWVGIGFDNGWIWTISLLAGAAAATFFVLRVPKRRAAADAELLEKLSRA